MADDVESKVLRYKSRLQNSTDEEKLQETLFKIADIPITVDILQKTKIGKVVNGLRKRGGDLGILAKDIVTEWKSMVARVQSKEEEEENDHSHSEKPNSSPEVENNARSPEHNHLEEDDSSPQEKSRISKVKKHRTDRHSSHQSSSHSKGEKHRESESRYSSKERDSRNSLNQEQRSKRDGKKFEENRNNSSSGDGRKSSSNDYKQSKSENISKSERSHEKSEKIENHKSHKSHSKTKECELSSESINKKESKHSETKHSESRNSSKDSIKHSDHKHRHSSSHKSESRQSGSRHSNSQSGSKDKSHSKHSNNDNGQSGNHSKHSSSSSKNKNHDDRKSSSHLLENCDKIRRDTKHSSGKSGDEGLTATKRSKHTLSDSESENSEEDKEDNNQSKVLGHWDGLSSDVEMEEEPGGFFFNDEYVDHEALLNEALNKYHMEPQILAPSNSSDKKSPKTSAKEVEKDNPRKDDKHSDLSKKKKDYDDKERKERDKKGDSKSHSSHKSKSNSSSKSSSHKRDRESRKRKHDQDGKPESKKSRSNTESKESVSFEESIGIPVKKPKADPNYEKLKSKFKIKKKGEASKESKPRTEKLAPVKSETESSDKLKVPVPGSKLKISERDLAGLIRNNTASSYRNFEEPPSASSQFDESLIGQKSYAKTQVYSGKKTNTVLKVYSLQEICINLLMNYIDSIEAVGSSVPFYILEPVLKKCTPAQLYRIEDYNPHFLEESDHLWKLHCEREFRDSKPEEFETYRELYLRKFDEKERKFKMIKDNISQSMAKAAPERTAKLAYVDSYVKPPREVRRQQIKYGTAGSSSGERSKKFAHLMDPIAIGRKEREEKAVKQKAPMMQKTMMMLKKMRR